MGGYFLQPALQLPWRVDGLDVLYGIGASHHSAELGANVDLFDDNDPVSVLPIGYTVMGNLIFIGTSPDEYVIAVKKAFSDEIATPAQSLEEFFGLLK
jgi:hypothetical protein